MGSVATAGLFAAAGATAAPPRTLAASGDGLWGYAEADPIVVGVIVAAVVVLGFVYLVLRLTGNLDPRRKRERGDRGRD